MVRTRETTTATWRQAHARARDSRSSPRSVKVPGVNRSQGRCRRHRMATCFVVMGFGKKTDFESGRTLDLDKSYHNVIKPAVKAAGLDCVRADEIVHAGI